MKISKKLVIDRSWTVFLDRDGVINERIPNGYVRNLGEWKFVPGALEAIVKLSTMFSRVIVVTNQQGIGKEWMTEEDLDEIHRHLKREVAAGGGEITAIYHCSELASDPDNCRKPSPAMGLKAKSDYPDIQFVKSIMVGDTSSDMAFGKYLGMHTVRIGKEKTDPEMTDFICDSLRHFVSCL